MHSEHTRLVKTKSVKAVKQLITETLQNIIVNCEFIVTEKMSDEMVETANELVIDIEVIIEWYKKGRSKAVAMDYVNDYAIMDTRFIKLVGDISEDRYYYNLCLGRLTISE